MFNADRLRARMAEQSLSQSELARRVGVSQASIYRLVKGDAYGSKHLHRIARELGTTPAYLAGETDDPDLDALPPPPPAPPLIMMSVNLPSERALTRMFEALLAGIDPEIPRAEQAQLLAQRLPIGLSHLRDLLPESVKPSADRGQEDDDEARATPHLEPLRR